MTLKRYTNFEEKLSCGLKKNLRNLANFHQSTFLATQEVEVIVFPYATETEMKNGVASENKKMYLKINIFILTVFINQTSIWLFRRVLPLYRNKSTALIYRANQQDGFYTMSKLD